MLPFAKIVVLVEGCGKFQLELISNITSAG